MSNFGSIVFPGGLFGNHVRWLLFVDNKFINPFGNQDQSSKLAFIQKNIYGNTRSWNSWLQVEWKYRTELDQQLMVSHSNWEWEKETNQKELYLSCNDVALPFLHYYHINLGINNGTPESLMSGLLNWGKEFDVIKTRIVEFPNKKIMLSDQLFQPVLPYEWYKEIVDFFEFSDNYNLAQEIHTMHYKCRKKSAKEFHQYFTSSIFLDNLEKIRVLGEGNI